MGLQGPPIPGSGGGSGSPCSDRTCLLFDLLTDVPLTLAFLWSSKGRLQVLVSLPGKMSVQLAPLIIHLRGFSSEVTS